MATDWGTQWQKDIFDAMVQTGQYTVGDTDYTAVDQLGNPIEGGVTNLNVSGFGQMGAMTPEGFRQSGDAVRAKTKESRRKSRINTLLAAGGAAAAVAATGGFALSGAAGTGGSTAATSGTLAKTAAGGAKAAGAGATKGTGIITGAKTGAGAGSLATKAGVKAGAGGTGLDVSNAANGLDVNAAANGLDANFDEIIPTPDISSGVNLIDATGDGGGWFQRARDWFGDRTDDFQDFMNNVSNDADGGFNWGQILPGIADIAGAIDYSRQIDKATDAQLTMNQRAIDFLTETRDMEWEAGATGRGIRDDALTRMADMTGIGDPNYEFSPDDPSYQWRMDQGIKAMDASAAARGSMGSGGYSKDLIGYAQGLASTEYGASYNRLAGLAGTAMTPSNSSSYNASIAGIMQDQGMAAASGDIAGANNRSGMWNGIVDIAQGFLS